MNQAFSNVGATVVITHRVRSDKHAEYEAWVDEISPLSRSAPGHLDWHLVRPIPGATETYTVIIRFQTAEHVKNWINSSEREDGSAYDGTGTGRCWPIFTGERGHYELAAGRDAKPFIAAMERFANEGGMLSEQVWDGADLPEKGMMRGLPTGAAMPLCWSHAEYVSLVRSVHDGVCFDRVEPAFQRYVVERKPHSHEMWSARHPIRRMPLARTLRLIVVADATIVWSANGWGSTQTMETTAIEALNLWFADLPTEDCPVGSCIEFTFFWKEAGRWEGRNYSVAVDKSIATVSPDRASGIPKSTGVHHDAA
jgi:heme-degrading monooxygenase HmoA